MTTARHVVARAVLVATAVVLVAPAALVLVGGFVPRAPVVGPFGRLVLPFLPALLVGPAIAVVLAAAALRLGGGRVTGLLMALTLVILAGSCLATGQLWSVANANGASFSPLAQLTPPPLRTASDRRIYATVDGQQLMAEIWRPAPATAALGRSAVLYVHGGAFVGGVVGSRPELFTSLVEAGIVVVDVEYRLAPPPRWDQAPADVLCALRWVATNATELGIDPARIVVAGDSAGGNLALLAAYAAGTDGIAASCGSERVRPAAVFAIAPAADLVGIWTDRTLTSAGRNFPEAYIGGTPTEFPDRYRAASPGWLVRPGLPPTLIITGASDRIVPLERVTPLVQQLRDAQNDAKLIVVPFADHGFDGEPGAFGYQLEASVIPQFVAAHT